MAGREGLEVEFPDFGQIHEESFLLERVRQDMAKEAADEAKNNKSVPVGYVDEGDLTG